MKQLNLLKTLFLLCALVVGSLNSWAADPEVTLDFTKAGTDWKIPTSGTNKSKTSFTNGDYTIYLYATTNYKANSGYLILGKKDSYMELPAFDFDVEKIEVLGHSGASAAVKQNIYVGETAVSTETEGADGATNSYAIASGYQAAGNVYKLVITSGHNTQIDYVKIYKKASGGDPVAVTGVTLNKSSIELTAGETETLTATVAPAEATNKNVTWASDDESVATVAAGVVTAVAEGTCTITVTTVDGGKTATCDVTVNAAPILPIAATLDFTEAGWGFPTDYVKDTENSYTTGGYTITMGAAASGYKAYVVSEKVVSLLFGKENATLTLPAFDFNVSKLKVYGYSTASGKVTFNVFVGSGAVSTEVTSSKVEHEFEIAADKQAAGTVYVIKVTNDNNCQISKIEVFGYDNKEVTAAGYATYVTEHNVEFVEGDAYAVTIDGGVAKLTPVTQVRKNVPVLLKGAGVKTIDVIEETPAAITTDLKVSTGGEPSNAYVLANKTYGVGFYKWNGGSLTSGKVYLDASTSAHELEFIGFEDESGDVTGIEATLKSNEVKNNIFFNLAGQRVAQPTKGLYIVNGKKVIIK